ncbi:hypothetical protein DQQ10_12835 [Pseudochryseolinea flava]|uniref:Uncharacterized protein n=2 Tax=Pseudochryseolinea flava TaxID=2059302 RepID=A0A364Y4L7_9BACT|nr:hypothetical protein DQQ10_12835 [Pseudochryseolinea flava]
MAQTGDILSDNIRWHSSQSIIMTSGMPLNHTCEVKTRPLENKIILDQNGRIGEFTILRYLSTWNDISQVGSITFEVTFGDTSGTVSFERDADGMEIVIDMTSNPSGVKRKIIVDQIITE